MTWPKGDTPFDIEPALAKAREIERATKVDGALARQAAAVVATLGEYVDSLPPAQRRGTALRLIAEIRRKPGP